MAKKTNYNKMSTETVKSEVENVTGVNEVVEEPTEKVETVKIVKGTVANCSKLNMRKEPKKNATVIAVLAAKTKVEVESNASTDDWYKVITKDGLEGYCMKEFITLK